MTKYAVITGASSGIGMATAHKLAEQGYDLLVTGRRQDRLEELAKKLETHRGVKIHVSVFDIRVRSEVEKAVQSFPAEFKAPDVLVNNAGLAAGLGEIKDGDPDDWDQMIDTNVKGLLYISRQLLPEMAARRTGHVVNIGSIAGKEIYPGGNVYCGTKHMVDALSKSMRREMAEDGIRISAIHPGAVETEFSLVRFKGDSAKASKVYEGFENLLAEDIANAIWYVLSQPRHVNINELTIMPMAQPAAGVVIRDKGL